MKDSFEIILRKTAQEEAPHVPEPPKDYEEYIENILNGLPDRSFLRKSRPAGWEGRHRAGRSACCRPGKGAFPEGELKRITDSSEYDGKGVAFLTSRRTFLLPEEELSDGEILKIIAFMAKREKAVKGGKD